MDDAWGRLYKILTEARQNIEVKIGRKLKTRNSTLNAKEIRYINTVHKIITTGRPEGVTRNRILKALTGATANVRRRGNPGTPRNKERDIQTALDFAAFQGSRIDFMRTYQDWIAEERGFNKALSRGEKYLMEENDKLRTEIAFLEFKQLVAKMAQ